MKKFRVTRTYLTTYEWEIEAEDEQEAEDLANDMTLDGRSEIDCYWDDSTVREIKE